ncbi:Leucyl/phenylalanyl-tRNA--protein transferase [Austwickia sp. TVS 96-490-7B]|uniref:leucyl/phenylalanyl-tRNA--protein transferase n=1 Tax=Austwickia sp. TVS 96-490-7B TaxID=2830843 RepID=UPI001C570B4A|nr:leucyl/phenylalanyl-tRNA--protein transferase [Austwickia sp. TVS 96-490-7B]MBW3086085.1 Leucyl/phenylalanyl-tRNA--protein transferase [Austwickia sp. TVS 96-490-7B]
MPQPVEPPATPWNLCDLALTEDEDLVAVGADLEPGTLLEGYRSGLFPMGLDDDGAPPFGWWSPDPRGVLDPAQMHLSRSLRRSMRTWRFTWDSDFDAVLTGCADPTRPGRWITDEIRGAYRELYDLGWAHSVEVWDGDELIGGLYGVAVGGLFAGESMFRRRTDASKAALAALVAVMRTDHDPRRIIDVQWATPHLSSLGVQEIPRDDYFDRLALALQAPPLNVPSGTSIQVPFRAR